MNVYDIYTNDMSRVLAKSLSLSPHNKRCGIELDNLSVRSGYLQWQLLKNEEQKYMVDNDYRQRKSCVMINGDEMHESYNGLGVCDKEDTIIKIFDQGQDVISRMCDKTRRSIRENPGVYQSELARMEGFTKDVIDDNNWIIYSITRIMEKQGMIQINSGKNTTFTVLNDEPYVPIAYTKSKSHASKLEAAMAAHFFDKGYDFEQQVTFKDLRHRGQLRVDFKVRVGDTDIFVEVDGRQHYEHVEFFHKTKEEFELQQKRDAIKERYLREHDMNFIRIRYDEDIAKAFDEKVVKFLEF